ncbi:proteasome-interacting thioredoxin domain-containing protein [Toxoplasma gondii ME49]|uniref:Proteasome-interacting thioredoxin domain-containing protein n=2 Tax=Toxoplasma gondii TaxID=5811 RepID=S8FZM8_TOXGM|nr:proteasome-interacting thioredoxin domain-containing protein [Toxoplasma gondii ME49]EPT24675.1 proteasome-interacting thioredoxin domain-containing protein [Toxoplasma gondii ME49]KYF48804.1 proteasome-interacting thioredoxin domain-containing protein [Toxoplasma gondii ARI]|eukprot:XP_018634829.1 proteasome-interacting thioredoxin domain-containing protein [Toxoplasma gondii ME49]
MSQARDVHSGAAGRGVVFLCLPIRRQMRVVGTGHAASQQKYYTEAVCMQWLREAQGRLCPEQVWRVSLATSRESLCEVPNIKRSSAFISHVNKAADSAFDRLGLSRGFSAITACWGGRQRFACSVNRNLGDTILIFHGLRRVSSARLLKRYGSIDTQREKVVDIHIGIMEGTSLMSLIDKSKVECLNEDAQHSIRDIIEQTSKSAYLSSSNEDPQLLIKLGFTSPVKLSSLMIKSPPGSAAAGEVPTTIKLFTNNLAMGFSEAESEPPIQEVTLDENEVENGCTVPLRFVKFQTVSTLVIYVESNNGSDQTKISEIKVCGVPTEKLEMKEWKPVKESERLAPNDT